ncbi:hypothetical protein DITRI_Ditri15bG0064800 [Diplodiscus trichospermus]
MGALSLMTILSVIIGRIFQSVPAQFPTTLPIGEYAAITLLVFFGLKSIKDAWDLPPTVAKKGGDLMNLSKPRNLRKKRCQSDSEIPLNLSGSHSALYSLL